MKRGIGMAVFEFLIIGLVSIVNLKLFSHFLVKILNEMTSGNSKRNLY